MTEVGWELIGCDHATEKGGGEEDRKVPPLNAIALGHEKQDIPYARSVVMMAIGRTRQKLSSNVEMGTNSNTLRCERALLLRRRRGRLPQWSRVCPPCRIEKRALLDCVSGEEEGGGPQTIRASQKRLPLKSPPPPLSFLLSHFRPFEGEEE